MARLVQCRLLVLSHLDVLALRDKVAIALASLLGQLDQLVMESLQGRPLIVIGHMAPQPTMEVTVRHNVPTRTTVNKTRRQCLQCRGVEQCRLHRLHLCPQSREVPCTPGRLPIKSPFYPRQRLLHQGQEPLVVWAGVQIRMSSMMTTTGHRMLMDRKCQILMLCQRRVLEDRLMKICQVCSGRKRPPQQEVNMLPSSRSISNQPSILPMMMFRTRITTMDSRMTMRNRNPYHTQLERIVLEFRQVLRLGHLNFSLLSRIE